MKRKGITQKQYLTEFVARIKMLGEGNGKDLTRDELYAINNRIRDVLLCCAVTAAKKTYARHYED